MSQKETAFMGRIIASLSHEIKNVLATIKESAGLMEDILNLQPEKDSPQQVRLNNAAANIKKQIDRGVDVVLGLNRFAHSMDEPKAEIDLNELSAQMAFLMNRFAHKLGISLGSVSHSKPLKMVTDPFVMEMILAAAVDVCLSRSEKGTDIRIEPCVVEGRPGVWVGSSLNAPPETLPPEADCPEELSTLMEDLERLHARIYDVGSAGICGLLIEFQDSETCT